MMSNPNKEYYRVDEVSDYFAISVITVYRLMHEGELKRTKIRGCLRILRYIELLCWHMTFSELWVKSFYEKSPHNKILVKHTNTIYKWYKNLNKSCLRSGKYQYHSIFSSEYI